MGWGYGKQYSIRDRIYKSLSLDTTNNNEIVKIYKCSILYMGSLEIKLFVFKTGERRIRLSYNSENTKAKIYTVNEYKTKVAICDYLQDFLLDQYYLKDAYGFSNISEVTESKTTPKIEVTKQKTKQNKIKKCSKQQNTNFTSKDQAKNYINSFRDFDIITDLKFKINGWRFNHLSNRLIEQNKNTYLWEICYYNTETQTSLRFNVSTKFNKKDDSLSIDFITFEI
jgi:hypothetical protein